MIRTIANYVFGIFGYRTTANVGENRGFGTPIGFNRGTRRVKFINGSLGIKGRYFRKLYEGQSVVLTTGFGGNLKAGITVGITVSVDW